MTRSIQVTGSTFDEALSAAVAALVDQPVAEVELRLRAPGISELEGRIELVLDLMRDGASDDAVTRTGADEPAGDGDATPGPAASRTDAEPDEATDADASGSDGEVQEEDEGGGRPAVAEEGLDGEADLDEDEEEAEELDDREDTLESEAEAAADFVEGLLDALDLPGDLRIRLDDDHAEIEIVDVGSGALIGRRGQTLEAIQELLRCALQREFQRRARVKVDVEGYRARRLEKLVEKAEEAIEQVLATGEPERLEPMDVFERKAVHHLVAEVDGLDSRSQGREPARRVIIERI